MTMPPRITQVGDLERADHYHLPADAACFFWGEYTPYEHTDGKKWNFSPTNQLAWSGCSWTPRTNLLGLLERNDLDTVITRFCRATCAARHATRPARWTSKRLHGHVPK